MKTIDVKSLFFGIKYRFNEIVLAAALVFVITAGFQFERRGKAAASAYQVINSKNFDNVEFGNNTIERTKQGYLQDINYYKRQLISLEGNLGVEQMRKHPNQKRIDYLKYQIGCMQYDISLKQSESENILAHTISNKQ